MMDWDTITATDLLALFRSLCTGDKVVTKVQIFPSLYGIEQMKKDSLYGPPTDIFAQDSSKKHLYKRRKKKNEAESSSSSDDDQGVDVETAAAYDQARLRKYEI